MAGRKSSNVKSLDGFQSRLQAVAGAGERAQPSEVVRCSNAPDRSRRRAHLDGVGLSAFPGVADAAKQLAVGESGGGKERVLSPAQIIEFQCS